MPAGAFAGSGTTIIAAESTGRVCLAMEIDPRYCDVIVERRRGRDADRDLSALRAAHLAG